MEDLTIKAHRYFDLFKNKNVKGLENEIYADDIYLRDWNGQWKGKNAVLEMNENIFENEFKITIESVKQADKTTIVLFHMYIGGSELKVCDIIDWNEEGKIEKILAYNG
jgi:hypothetical protein